MKLFLSIFLFGPLTALAQVSISLSSGYGSWSMKSMRQWQEAVRAEYPVEVKTISSYPAFSFVELSALQQSDKWFRGVALSTGTTGGRLYYGDYTGTIVMDQDLAFYGLSAIIGRTINRETKKFLLIASLRPGVTMTKMSYQYEQVVLGTQTDALSNKFSSYNLTLQSTLSAIRRFGRIGVEGLVGYHLTVIGGKLTYADPENMPNYQGNVNYLIRGKNTPVKAQWSGVRLSLGLSFQVNR